MEKEKTEEQRREHAHRAIRQAADRMGMGEFWEKTRTSRIPEGFGLCSSCKNFEFARTEFRMAFVSCDYMEGKAKPSSVEPIVDCTNYSKIGILSLAEMTEIAILIDSDKKGPIGFA